MQPHTPIPPSKQSPNKLPTPHMIVAITVLTLLGSGYCHSQSHEIGQTMNANLKQEKRIAALEKRIAEAGDDFVSLTAEEYDLLLSQPIGTVDGFEPLATTAGRIMVGIGFGDGPKIYKTHIQTIFPKIPNIEGGEVFVIFDCVKGTNGLDYLDRMSNTENEEKDFTQLVLDIRTAGSTSYWFGSRYVNLRDPSDSITVRALGALGDDVKLSALSGNIVMHLPTNIIGLVLAKADIGVEKPFAGGSLTLKNIAKDRISFHFSGDTKKIYAWTVYDAKGNILAQNGTSLQDGLYQIKAKNPQSVKIYQSEVVRKEYPFAYGTGGQATSEGVSSTQQQKSAPPAQKTEILNATMNTVQTNNAASVYLEQNDPIFLSIKGRTVTDLKRSAEKSDPESTENKLVAAKIKTWTKEQQDRLQALGEKSITDYAAQTRFDVGIFMLVFDVLGKRNQKEIAEEYDIRVQYCGGNKYVAEYWEDGLAVNSEAHALAEAHKLAASEYAKKHPNDGIGNVDEVKKTYANVRKSIKAGKQERYTKVMALLYSREKDGSIVFHDPGQPMIDFVNSNSK